jgi:hypothetical protein
MDRNIQVKVHTLSDSLEARLKVRQLACELGFNLKDQAYISLAAWELAVQLSLGITRKGTINITLIGQEEGHPGIQIVCGTRRVSESDLKTITSGDVKSLVDKLEIERPNINGNDIEIVAVKWKKSGGTDHVSN